MKTVLLVLDGIADEPIESLDGKTPLEIAKKPNMNALAQTGTVGRLRLGTKTPPSQETTCLGVLGYAKDGDFTARGPLSASAIELKITGDEWLAACRLVTVADGKLIDSRAGDIGERESAALYEALNRLLKNHDMRVYTDDGRSHVLTVREEAHFDKFDELDLRGPDEMIGKDVWGAWSKSGTGSRLKAVLTEAAELLETHEVNKVRVDLNENPANALWVWGAGKSLRLKPLPIAVKTVVLSSSDIWKGAARSAGVEWSSTQIPAQAESADLAELSSRVLSWSRSHDLVIVQVDAADRSSMAGDFKKKIRWIEAFDQHLVGPLREHFKNAADARIAVVSGHVTSTDRRERTSSEAPFLAWKPGNTAAATADAAPLEFTEECAGRSGKVVNGGADFLKKLV